ncbi:dihydrofolate reductase-like domain-containing protein [Aspergillus californicus]
MAPRLWKTRLFTATSLDGSIARKNNDILWLTSPALNPAHIAPSSPGTKQTPTFEQHISGIDFIVMGRVTFEVCCNMTDWPYPKDKNLLVLSSTLDTESISSLTSNSTLDTKPRIVSSLDEVEMILRGEDAKWVYADRGETVRGFLSRGWVDEMVLTFAHILLGNMGGPGRSLFSSFGFHLEEDVKFTLLGVDVIEGGMASCYYRVLR